MRQFVALRRAISQRRLIYRYPDMQFLAALHRVDIKPLEELLSPDIAPKSFDEKTEMVLEKRALELLAERRKQHGRQ